MSEDLRILLVEDSTVDAEIIIRELRSAGFDPKWQRVETESAYLQHLHAGLDLVLADYGLPQFNGLRALELLQQSGLDLPFILVSGTIGEESAVVAIKLGATDFLLKDRLKRLGPAVTHAIAETRLRRERQQVDEALQATRGKLQQLLEYSPAVLYAVKIEGEQLTPYLCSENITRLLGFTVAETLSMEWWLTHIHSEDHARAFASVAETITNNTSLTEYRMQHKDGSYRWVADNRRLVRNHDGEPVEFVGVWTDVTERKLADIRIKYLNRVFAMLSGVNTLIVRVPDRKQLFIEACNIAVRTGGFCIALIGIVDQDTRFIVPAASAGVSDEILTAFNLLVSKGELAGHSMVARAIRGKTPVISNDSQHDSQVPAGNKFAECGIRSMAIFPLIVADKAVGAFGLYACETEFFQEEEMQLLSELAGDIAFAIDHIEKQERLNYVAGHDVLTGLANRNLFLERLAEYKRAAIAGGHKLALFLVDLERFRSINDSLGRTAGDALLVEVTRWLTRNTESANMLARVGADQFAIVLPVVKQDGDITQFLEKLINAFHDYRFHLNDAEFQIVAKYGISIFPDDGTDKEVLFKNAEAALKKAKESGSRSLFYTQGMNDRIASKLLLENQLRQAFANGEFVLHYQPKVNLTTGRVTSAEALIRWNDPRNGLVPPGQFIPILEETGLIHEVGRWALRQAIEDYLRWCSLDLTAVRIAVNVSALQLRSPSFVEEIRQAVNIKPHAAAGVELEITESMIMHDVHATMASLKAIRELGVTIAIDDFGTGFSSLGYLAKLPLDTLKVDRSFIIDMTTGPAGLALVSTIIGLAHALKLEVVAEGVETEEQSRLLRLLGCDEMQGFVFSKPVSAEIFEAKFLVSARNN